MKVKTSGEERGSLLLEIVLITAVFAIFASFILPHAAKLYRTAVLEYEAEHFFSDLRYLQRLSRSTTARDDDGRSIVDEVTGSPEIDIIDHGTAYAVMAIGVGTAGRVQKNVYRLHGDIVIRWQSNAVTSQPSAVIRFYEDGKPSGSASGYTFELFSRAHTDEKIRVIIDPAGRIRIARAFEK